MKKMSLLLMVSLIISMMIACGKSNTGEAKHVKSPPETSQTDTKAVVTTPEKTYQIGDQGPVGGYVFYDKGEYTDGWRYLEAAPENTDINAEWSTTDENKEIVGLKTDIGAGKNNTNLIIQGFKNIDANATAAEYCAALDVNGFTDWFLPSKDELNLMYVNLYQKGLGGFAPIPFDEFAGWWRSESYRSSSQEDYDGAMYQNFDDIGIQRYWRKHYDLRVRPARAF